MSTPDASSNGNQTEPRKWSQEWVEQQAAKIKAEVAAMPPVSEWTPEQKKSGGLWTLKVIEQHFGDLTPEQHAEHPPDFSEQVDHYLYGTPKKPRPKRFS